MGIFSQIRNDRDRRFKVFRYGRAGRHQPAGDTAHPIKYHFYLHIARVLLELIGDSYRHVIFVEDEKVALDVIGGGGDCLWAAERAPVGGIWRVSIHAHGCRFRAG